MPSFIVKLAPEKYVMWSTIADAPTTTIMTRAELEGFVRDEFGNEGLRALPERMARVEQTGTSAIDGDTTAQMIAGNRAGANEATLTLEEIIERYTVLPSSEAKSK